jgi:hypothetical protein
MYNGPKKNDKDIQHKYHKMAKEGRIALENFETLFGAAGTQT